MNHPSDYMNQYHQSSSEDQSNHNISMQLRRSPHLHHPHKNSSISMIHPLVKAKKHKKSVKIVMQKPRSQLPKPKKKVQVAKDFFVLGNSYYSCKSIDEISNRLIHKQSQRIMKEQRLRKKQKQCLKKIEKYFKTFIQNVRSKPIFRKQQKVELYRLLKEERHSHSEEFELESMLRGAFDSLQKRCEKLRQEYPSQTMLINRWKNFKMHQLMTAQSFLQQEKILSIDIFDLQKQYRFLHEEQFFPELRQEANYLQQQIESHLNAPAPSYGQQKQDEGVTWVMRKLLVFLSQRPNTWDTVAQSLQLYERGLRDQPLLSDSLFIQFQRYQVGCAQSQNQAQQLSYLHIFNKSVFDLINQTAKKMQVISVSLDCLQQIFVTAVHELSEQEVTVWNEQILLWVQILIYEQLLDDSLQDFLDFY